MTLKIPDTAHYAMIVETSHTIHHEADQRSRDYPGHGYPAWTETINSIEYIPFSNLTEVEDWIKDRWNKDKKYRVVKVEPMKVETEVKIVVT